MPAVPGPSGAGAPRERDVASALKTYRTVGDTRLNEPLSAIGAKGLFTKELETDLAKGKVHCCVHSLKDLPTEMPPGLEVVALLPREDPRDVLVGQPRSSAHARWTTCRRVHASGRRAFGAGRATWRCARTSRSLSCAATSPRASRKVEERQVDAAILAAAGLHRLGMSQHISDYLALPAWLPAAGQGAIAIQIRRDDEELRALFAPLADRATMSDTAAERAFLAALQGGCQVPIGAAVVRLGENSRVLHGFIAARAVSARFGGSG